MAAVHKYKQPKNLLCVTMQKVRRVTVIVIVIKLSTQPFKYEYHIKL